jgi:hypothetical protein
VLDLPSGEKYSLEIDALRMKGFGGGNNTGDGGGGGGNASASGDDDAAAAAAAVAVAEAGGNLIGRAPPTLFEPMHGEAHR